MVIQDQIKYLSEQVDISTESQESVVNKIFF